MSRAFQQLEGPDDVRLDEASRALDRAVDVALGSKVDHRFGTVIRVHRLHQLAIPDVAADEAYA
jgi:hypothetical protein